MARRSGLMTYEFNPRHFRVASLADVLAATEGDPPHATIAIGYGKSGPKLKPSDEELTGVPVNQKVRWECGVPFRLTFAEEPDSRKPGTVKFEGVEQDGYETRYATEVHFTGQSAAAGKKVKIDYVIQVKVDGKWLGKDPSVIIDTTKASTYVLVPKSLRVDPALLAPAGAAAERNTASRRRPSGPAVKPRAARKKSGPR